MNSQELKNQVETIREAFSYINRFKNELFVIKIDDTLVDTPFFPLLIKDIVYLYRMGIKIILVPGAKKRINEILDSSGIKYSSHKGVRITPVSSVTAVKMAVSDVSNRIITLLSENNVNAVTGNWVKARAIGVRDGIDFQSSGLVEKVQSDVISSIVEQGLIPIFSNIGWNANGKPYNISSNELASKISIEFKAAKLFFIISSGGIPAADFKIPENVDVQDNGAVSQMSVQQAGCFLDMNDSDEYNVFFNMVALAYKTCNSGVRRVHIVDGNIEGIVLKEIFSNQGMGTLIYSNTLENIRPISGSDVPDLLKLMEPLVKKDILIPRSAGDIMKNRDDYFVYEVDGIIHGCGALHVYPEEKKGELSAIAVDENYSKRSIGSKIVRFLIEKSAALSLKEVFVLTTQSSDWFTQFGFEDTGIDTLPEEKKMIYNRKRNSRILKYAPSEKRISHIFNVD